LPLRGWDRNDGLRGFESCYVHIGLKPVRIFCVAVLMGDALRSLAQKWASYWMNKLVSRAFRITGGHDVHQGIHCTGQSENYGRETISLSPDANRTPPRLLGHQVRSLFAIPTELPMSLRPHILSSHIRLDPVILLDIRR
jgi:hypothetical protein